MTREQERARAKRRYEKVQAARAAKEARDKRRRQIGAVVATVAMVLAIVAGVAMAMRPGGTDAASGPTATAVTPARDVTTPAATPTEVAEPGSTPGSTAGGSSPAAAPAGLKCSTPPPAQTKPKTFGRVPDKAAAAGKTWLAELETNCGRISVELDGKAAPQTVASFLFLAKEGYWAPSACHRLTTSGIYVLQCGDPTGTGGGTPGYGYGIENAPASGAYPRGTLAMARTQDPTSNGGQFFVVYKDTELPTQGGGYSIFGKVVAGLDMVDRIAGAGADDSNAPGDGHPKAPISIVKVSVTEKKA